MCFYLRFSVSVDHFFTLLHTSRNITKDLTKGMDYIFSFPYFEFSHKTCLSQQQKLKVIVWRFNWSCMFLWEEHALHTLLVSENGCKSCRTEPPELRHTNWVQPVSGNMAINPWVCCCMLLCTVHIWKLRSYASLILRMK